MTIMEINSKEEFSIPYFLNASENRLIVVGYFDYNALEQMQDIAMQYEDKVHIFLVNIQEVEGVAQQNGVFVTPTFHFYKNFEQVASLEDMGLDRLHHMIQMRC